MSAGYSKTPLIKKLGIKAGDRVLIVNAPEDYGDTLGALPEGVVLIEAADGDPVDFVHLFSDSREALEAQFPALKAALAKDGMLWVSWPKRASKVPTDLSEDVIRAIGLAGGLVDVKVAAVDAVWSALKFVYRLADR